MGFIILLVFIVISVLIVGLVLLQEGKGGGLVGMSTGMDGVMGAKNPLRRMTAWLFVVFVIMAVGINLYYRPGAEAAIPTGAAIPTDSQRVLEESAISTGPLILAEPEPEGTLRPTDGEPAPEAPVESIRPPEQPAEPPAAEGGTPAEGADETPVTPTETTAETVETVSPEATPAESTGEPDAAAPEAPALEPAPAAENPGADASPAPTATE